tara:strand:+ start:751 stop:1224 length:474 start_codon:yes stop_codon:yes gene_type:complete
MAITTAAGITSTTVTTTQQAPLGFELVVPNGDQGEQVYVYIFNDEASNPLAVGMLAQIDTDYVPYHAIISTGPHAAQKIIGAAQTAIPAGSYGFVLKRGVGLAQGDGSVAQGESIVSHSSGQVDTMAAGEEHQVIGLALAADGSAGDTFSVLLDCRG